MNSIKIFIVIEREPTTLNIKEEIKILLMNIKQTKGANSVQKILQSVWTFTILIQKLKIGIFLLCLEVLIRYKLFKKKLINVL